MLPGIYAEDFEYNGIQYTITSDNTVSTRAGESYYKPGNSIAGDVVIPSIVYYDNMEYAVTEISNFAFSYSENLTGITLPEGLTSIGDKAFYGCSSLSSIAFPEELTSIGESAFYYCSSLKNLTLPEKLTTIGEEAFSYCSSLKSVTLPGKLTSISKYAFSNCRSLTSVDLPEELTSLGGYAFAYCPSLTSVTLPENLTSIGAYAFYNCTSMAKVKCLSANPPSIGTKAFENIATDEVIVPYKSADSYNSSDWANSFNSITEAPPVVMLDGNFVGTLIANGSEVTLGQVVKGPEIILELQTDEEYVLSEVLLNGENITDQIIDNKLTISLTQEENTLTINCVSKIGIRIVFTGEGEVLVNSAYAENNKLIEGTDFDLLILPADGWEIKSISYAGNDVANNLHNHHLSLSAADNIKTVDIVFSKIEDPGEATLTVKGHDSHSFRHTYKAGTEAKIRIQNEDGWDLESVLFNDEDVTDRLDENNEFVTEPLHGHNTLSVVMSKSIVTEAEEIDCTPVSVKVRDNTIEVIGLNDGETIQIYDLEGKTVYSGTLHTVSLPANSIYIITTPTKAFKITL